MADPEKKAIREKCHLQQVQGIEAWCNRESCIYWRLLESQDVEAPNDRGCGLQHYGLLNKLDPEMAAWLLRMKKRLENMSPEAEKARITFHRRENDS